MNYYWFWGITTVGIGVLLLLLILSIGDVARVLNEIQARLDEIKWRLK